MKIWKWSRLLLAAAPLLSGCKGFWDVQSGSGGGTGTASGVFYVLNQKTAQIAGYSFTAGSTTLTAVTGGAISLGTAVPFTMAISPNGAFLYVSTAAGIFVYGVDSTTGALTLLNSSQVISADPAFAMQVDPSGGWLIEAVSGLANVRAIPLDSTTGVLLTGATEQTVNLPSGATAVQHMAMTRSSAANPYVFVAMGTSGTAVIPFNSAASGDPFGTVSVIKPVSTGGDTTVAVDVSRPLLYVGETVAVSGSNPGGVRVFTIAANSTLTEVSGSPYGTGGIGPSAILPTTNYVYVANKAVSGSNTGNITGFAITSTGSVYSLTSVSTVAAGIGTIGLAEESKGTYLLAVNSSGTPDLNAYTFDTTTAGKLDSYATSSTGTDPVQAVSIVAVP